MFRPQGQLAQRFPHDDGTAKLSNHSPTSQHFFFPSLLPLSPGAKEKADTMLTRLSLSVMLLAFMALVQVQAAAAQGVDRTIFERPSFRRA